MSSVKVSYNRKSLPLTVDSSGLFLAGSDNREGKELPFLLVVNFAMMIEFLPTLKTSIIES
ncbi:MAG: hypothetical protein A2157_16580 [Deltaproteobacteria bacterium RBG_16_47_11]|nr:MAG: hypothetical protein A2157_16580 [Deltaproteobacteria bacterium RBG_16_47_11]